MATLVLQAAGAFAGNFIGGPFGAIIGQAAGAVAGSMIDQTLFGAGGRNSSGPRLSRLPGLSAAEGTPVARVFGRARAGGTLIWMTRFEEAAAVARSGGSGGKGSSPKTTTYSYYGNFAIGVCEGPIAEVRRIWADGEEIDQTRFTIRVYRGEETQTADPLIVAKEGADNAPAYKGLAYVVFERMPLGDFGNRIPQFSFEVVKPVKGVNEMVEGVCIIPGSSEFAYQPEAVMGSLGSGISQSENRHVLTRTSDWEASLDSLQGICPNLKSAALVVAWFGDDLRAGECTISPRSEKITKNVQGFNWSVAGLSRATARQVSDYDGKPAYGGTPSDESVIASIRDMKRRNIDIVFYPFVMMDIANGNALQDPWSGNAFQPAYPWRGRITCNPAPGQSSTVDGTAAASAQITSFFGSTNPAAHEWSYRRCILHYANLCVQAGGINAFIIGSELIGLTRVRSASGVYPAVSALVQLAVDVKAILGPGTKVSYAADWTEYGAHVLNNGTEVRFPLDPLWASSSIDFVGIDAYWPLADWRDGDTHADAAMYNSGHDLNYLRSRMRGGEAYDWHYADSTARDAQNRTTIADGAYGKPWMFRQKDVASWWSNVHFERSAGVELASPTPWSPAGKPVWFTETGCPAVDRGANAPNTFPDPKSSEGKLPPFSRGFRDDLIQARFIESFVSTFNPDADGFVPAANPLSPVYGGRMVDTSHILLWAWDARPFPAFPQQESVWADSEAWHTGHWLNGRLEAVEIGNLVYELANSENIASSVLQRPQIDAMIDGYIIEQSISPRNAIEPLASFFGFDAIISSGRIDFRSRGRRASFFISGESLAVRRSQGLFDMTRAQESELGRQISVSFHDGDTDYRVAALSSRRLDGASRRDVAIEMAIVTSRAEAQRRADIMLQDMWAGRESIEFELPPSHIALEIGDRITLGVDGEQRLFQITRIADSRTREISARSIEPAIFDHAPPFLSQARALPPAIAGAPRVDFLDLAIARDAPPALQFLSVFADPWPGRTAVWRAIGSDSFDFLKYVDQPAIVGETLSTFGPGVTGRFDRSNQLTIRLLRGALSSVDEPSAFIGRNAMAIQGADGKWEMFSFLNAELIADRTWRLSMFLRGLGGAEFRASQSVAAGANVILLDSAVVPLTSDLADLGQTHRYRIGPADREYSDPSYIDVTATAANEALKPYAPVRPAARRTASGVEISFLRRGRVDSDAWDPVNIPLAEESESYEIEVLNGTSVLRTLIGSSATILYPQASEITDFGSPQSQLDISLCQMSAIAGRGFAARTWINVQ